MTSISFWSLITVMVDYGYWYVRLGDFLCGAVVSYRRDLTNCLLRWCFCGLRADCPRFAQKSYLFMSWLGEEMAA